MEVVLDVVLDVVLEAVLEVVFEVVLDSVLNAVSLRLATPTDEGAVLGGQAAAASSIFEGDTRSDIMQCRGGLRREKVLADW